MDWPALARVLAELGALPLLVLDRNGVVRLCNRALERVLGCSHLEVEGQAWSALLPPERTAPTPGAWLAEAYRGVLHEQELVTVTAQGARLRLTLDLKLVGHGSQQALVLGVRRAVPVLDTLAGTRGDLDYDVALAGADFGQLSRLRTEGDLVPMVDDDQRCFALLHSRVDPCEDCPLRGGASGAWPRSTIRPRKDVSGAAERMAFEVLTAEALDHGTARVRVRTISGETLSSIQAARFEQVAHEAGLSQREREVMRYLVMGRSLRDIALVLDITERTVKYHQANVLEKLGADSRHDLVRLIF